MVQLPVLDQTGKKVGNIDVDVDAIAPKISKQLLHDIVVMYQANARQGTKGTKSRGMVAGSTKKMYRQKGTGQRPRRRSPQSGSPWWRSRVRADDSRLWTSHAAQGRASCDAHGGRWEN